MSLSSKTGPIKAWHTGRGYRLASEETAVIRLLEAGADSD